MSNVSDRATTDGGIVYLVGAGPGDPELMTLRGLRCLRTADVVLYDLLAPAALLQEAPATARRIYVGKSPERHCMSQEEINKLLIDLASQGRSVVRLKGGDPFVFGRGGEEALALRAANISFEIVPGVSSAIAGPEVAGIPVTFQQLARSFAVITGHSRLPLNRRLQRQADPVADTAAGDGLDHHDWRALAALDTLICLMSVRTLPAIVERLLGSGLAVETPVAIIERATTPEQRVTTGALHEIVEIATSVGIRSPAVIIIGNVVALHQALDPQPNSSDASASRGTFDDCHIASTTILE